MLALFAGVACWPFSDDAELAEMTVQRREGKVVVLRAGETIEVDDEASLEPRDVVQTHGGGEALVRLEGSRLLTLGSSSTVLVKSPRAVESQRGSVLAETEDSLEILFGSVEARATSGMLRVDRGISAARIASYEGDVTVSAPGEERLQIASLFEAAPSVNALPPAPDPYRLDETDPWDRQYLKEVVALQEDLEQLGAGLRAQIGNQRPNLGYFSALADGADVSFLRPYLRRAPINLLIGFTIASHDRHRSLRQSFEQAFSLYERGAKWAVAAAILDMKMEAVVADLEDIATVTVASSSDGEDSFTIAAAVASENGGQVPPGGELPIDPGPSEAPPPDPTDPPPSEKPDPPEDCQNSAECAVQDIQDELQPTPTPTPKPTDDPEDEGPLDVLNGGGGGGLLD